MLNAWPCQFPPWVAEITWQSAKAGAARSGSRPAWERLAAPANRMMILRRRITPSHAPSFKALEVRFAKVKSTAQSLPEGHSLECRPRVKSRPVHQAAGLGRGGSRLKAAGYALKGGRA